MPAVVFFCGFANGKQSDSVSVSVKQTNSLSGVGARFLLALRVFSFSAAFLLWRRSCCLRQVDGERVVGCDGAGLVCRVLSLSSDGDHVSSRRMNWSCELASAVASLGLEFGVEFYLTLEILWVIKDNICDVCYVFLVVRFNAIRHRVFRFRYHFMRN